MMKVLYTYHSEWGHTQDWGRRQPRESGVGQALTHAYVVRGSVRLHANGLVFYLGLACKGSRAKPRCNTRSHRLHGRTSLARYKYSEHRYRLSTAFSLSLTSQGHGTEEGIFLFSLRDTPAPEFWLYVYKSEVCWGHSCSPTSVEWVLSWELQWCSGFLSPLPPGQWRVHASRNTPRHFSEGVSRDIICRVQRRRPARGQFGGAGKTLPWCKGQIRKTWWWQHCSWVLHGHSVPGMAWVTTPSPTQPYKCALLLFPSSTGRGPHL